MTDIYKSPYVSTWDSEKELERNFFQRNLVLNVLQFRPFLKKTGFETTIQKTSETSCNSSQSWCETFKNWFTALQVKNTG